MNDKAQETARAPGTTSIAPGVLITIARLTALSVPGVVGMAPVPGGVNRLLRRGAAEGVRLEVEDDAASLDLHLVLALDSNVREVSRQVQSDVARAIEEMVGMNVKRIDVHIEDIGIGEREG